jgi:hypothetical protein
MMKYTQLAQQKFLAGTPYRVPAEAVESGTRLIEDWCDCVEAYRREYFDPVAQRMSNKTPIKADRSFSTAKQARATR